MPQDVLVIHGGNSFPTHAAYEAWLASKQFTREGMLGDDWKATLGKTLGADFTVFTPRMPNPQNASFDDWALWFEKFMTVMRPGVILVGHSLGGIFLAKYLATHAASVKVKALFLVAPLHTIAGEGLAPEFELPRNMNRVVEQVPKIHLYHSEDDQVVPFDNLLKYQADLPGAITSIFGDRGHFNMAAFPEIVADIRAAAAE
ncbi:MAG: hypothetical protein RLZZ324_854 [Candidatus Parcubacteria bacterium]|jgi:predicted alpha/beta hydrolase family esterase